MSATSRRFRGVSACVVVLATTTAGALVPSSAQAASRTVAESYQVPANGVLALTGHGYGHGHGMSQYGAQGAAKQGLDHRQILAFYYPGTTATTTSGTIRVLISADTDNDVQVLPTSGLSVRQVSTGATYLLPAAAGVKTWRLHAAGGTTAVDYDNGAWRSHRALSGDVEFYAAGPVTLRVGGTTRSYRGTLRLSGSDTVNVVGMDDYVQGVVPREMPTSWAPAAVQAQAVAARTYAARDRADNSSRYYQTCDTTACQVYGGLADEDARGNAAVAATANQILTHQGQPAFTQFSSSSGGWLSAGNVPYLVAKADPYDGHSGNPMNTWTASLTRAAIQQAYPSLGTLQRVAITRRDGNGEWYGRVEKMVLDGSKGDVSLSGATFRSKFGLRSHWFRFGSGASSAVTPPRAAIPVAVSAITLRWRALGANRSVVGKPVTGEYQLGAGKARRFQRGRIYAKANVGAHELHGRVLKAYAKRGEARSRLGFPTSRPVKFKRGVYARFETGVMKVFRSGRVTITYYR